MSKAEKKRHHRPEHKMYHVPGSAVGRERQARSTNCTTMCRGRWWEDDRGGTVGACKAKAELGLKQALRVTPETVETKNTSESKDG